MELSWTVRGAYANWTMTVTTTPPDPEEGIEFRDEWAAERFAPIHAHFLEVVDLMEATRVGEERPRNSAFVHMAASPYAL